MKRSVSILTLTSTFALLASLLPAATARAENELTLDEALAMARKANRNLIVEKTRVAQAQTNVESAWSALFPVVAAQGKYTRNYKEVTIDFSQMAGMMTTPDPNAPPAPPPLLLQPLNQLDAVISATMPLLAPAAYPALDAVKKNVHATEANYAAVEASVLFSVAQTFYAAAAGDEVLVARRSNIEVARATLANAKTRFAAGTVTKVDVDRAEVALVRFEQAEREARYGREQAYRGLSTLIQANAPFRVKTSLVAPKSETQTGEWELALQLRPELRALDLQLKSFEAQRAARGWQWAPTLSAFGNARVFNYDNFARDRHSWAAGGQLDWVIFDGGNRDAARHLADAQAQQVQAQADALRDTIRDDIANARLQLDTKLQATNAASRAVELSRETVDLVRTQYEAGSATQIDLLQAQDSLTASEEALAQAHFDVAVADLTLRRAAGTFPGK